MNIDAMLEKANTLMDPTPESRNLLRDLREAFDRLQSAPPVVPQVRLSTKYFPGQIKFTLHGPALPPGPGVQVRQVLRLYDDATRQALIRLGWTPPPDDPAGADAEADHAEPEG